MKKEKNGCEECGGKLFFSQSEVYCKKCGLVIEDSPINFGEEFSASDYEESAKRRRTGAPITWSNPDLTTTFNPWEVGKRFKRK